MDTQQELTRTGITIPAQRRAGEETSSTTTSPVPAAAPTGSETPGWEAHSWWAVVRVALSRAVLTMVVSLLVWAVVPMALGWAPRVIMSGSMEPLVHTGDVVVTRVVDAATLERGDVITTVDPDKAGKTRTHRYVQRDAEGQIVTKGDANREADSTPVSDDAVLGLGVLRVPYVGLPASWLAERDTVALGLGFAALSALVLAAWRPRTGARGSEGGDQRGGGTGGAGGAHRPTRRVRARGRRGVRAGAVATSMTGVALSVALVVPGTYAAFSAPTQNASSTLAAAASFTPYGDAVLADSPLLHWRLDETGGTAVADAASGNDPGTLRGTGTWGRSGALASETRSTALGLAGGYVTENNATTMSSSAFSTEMWFKSTSQAGGAMLTFGRNGGTATNTAAQVDRFLYLGADGRVRFVVGSARTTLASQGVLDDGAWHHVVATFATGTNGTKLYVDGALQAQGTATVRFANASFWRVGAENLTGLTSNPTSTTFAGDVDEVAVYNATLSAAQVKAHYDAARNG